MKTNNAKYTKPILSLPKLGAGSWQEAAGQHQELPDWT